MIPKSGNRFPAFAKPMVMGRCFAHASAGEGRSDKIMREQYGQIVSPINPIVL
jgi:hypothetical protein